MNIIVFEDSGTDRLFPITTGRPAYAITCASYRLIDWITELEGNLVGSVRPHLETLQLHDYPEFHQSLDPKFKSTWLINARLVPSVSNVKRLHQFKDSCPSAESAVVARNGWAVGSALLPTSSLVDKSPGEMREFLLGLANEPDQAEVVETDLELFEYPHHVVAQNMSAFRENIEHRISLGKFEKPQAGVYLGAGVSIGDHVVMDSSSGPIVLDENVKVGPFSLLRGPIYIGPNSKISEHASIKDEVSVSNNCKVGGEVEATVIEAYSNKQHHGFIGHSYLGSWINLGAGTCNSDLKNTYGKVNVEYGDRKVATEMQFMGCVMGDYAKTAINTSIFTGKMIGCGSMVYGFATTNVPSFVNYARLFGEVGGLPPEVIVSTQARMFARRNVDQRPCDVQLIHDMFRLTEFERPDRLSSDPISL
jgi:glucose-1-phosphate thymidylyltransferase